MSDAGVERLTPLLVKSLHELGAAGKPEAANRIAAQAYAALRHDEPRAAQRLNGLMHHLVRMERSATQGGNAMTDDRQLDVRTEAPMRRHTLIFETFEALSPGEAFVLVNDHDPKPLYYQFAAEKAGEFSWDYLEQGPTTWRVRIARTAARELAESAS